MTSLVAKVVLVGELMDELGCEWLEAISILTQKLADTAASSLLQHLGFELLPSSRKVSSE